MKLTLCALALVVSPIAYAQNTSGVFGPVIDEGERGWEYRATYDPDSEGLAQRFHYQQALNGELRWRAVAQVRKTDDSDVDLDYLRGEIVWQVTPDDQKYQSGFRFEGRYRFNDRPGDITVHWANQWKHIDYWTMRFIVGATQQIGNDPADGLQIQTRASAMTSLSYGPKIGLELFSEYGSTSDWLDANEQEHEFGPVAVWKLNEDWNLYSGALFGLTDASADSQLRFRLSKGF
ncbi:MAG: hypothetical protein P8H62_00750 [Henriciella sp.]|nr:hypothetical protein [Henriciella sp.]